MAIHLTPTELAREAGLERREVIEKCMEMGVPIFQGRIDKTLFLANMSEQAASPDRAAERGTRLTRRQERAGRAPAPHTIGYPLGARGGAMESSTAVPVHERATGSSTIADLIGLAAERHGDNPAIRHKRDGAWHDVSYAELGEIVSEVGRGLIDLGIQPGRPRGDPLHHPSRVDVRRLRHHGRRRASSCRSTRPTRRRSASGSPATPSRARSSARTPRRSPKIRAVRGDLPALETIIVIDPSGRRRRRDPARRAARARPRRATPPSSTSAPRGHARPALHDHLHVRHHRAAEGLRAHARQLPRRRLDVRARRGRAGGRRRLPVPARSRTRSRC